MRASFASRRVFIVRACEGKCVYDAVCVCAVYAVQEIRIETGSVLGLYRVFFFHPYADSRTRSCLDTTVLIRDKIARGKFAV